MGWRRGELVAVFCKLVTQLVDVNTMGLKRQPGRPGPATYTPGFTWEELSFDGNDDGIRSSGATEKCRTVQHGQCSREPILEGLVRFPSFLLAVNMIGCASNSIASAAPSPLHQGARRLRKSPRRTCATSPRNCQSQPCVNEQAT